MIAQARIWGVGVGPGDPELLTLKAHRIITMADVIAYPAPLDGDGLARSIVSAIMSFSFPSLAPIGPRFEDSRWIGAHLVV